MDHVRKTRLDLCCDLARQPLARCSRVTRRAPACRLVSQSVHDFDNITTWPSLLRKYGRSE
eukprot:10276308-Lingulodinium_polyedra.AAC.1